MRAWTSPCRTDSPAGTSPIGDVLAGDGSVLAGACRDNACVRSVDLIAARSVRSPIAADRANTTLVCVCTDARLTKLEAWLVARAVSPSATASDGNMTFCLASGAVDADTLVVSVMPPRRPRWPSVTPYSRPPAPPDCPAAADRL